MFYDSININMSMFSLKWQMDITHMKFYTGMVSAETKDTSWTIGAIRSELV